MAEATPGPLAGVTVVSLEHAVAAPIATRQLADLGARVIKIERPDGGDFARSYDHVVGGGLSSTFLWTSRGKESVVADLKSKDGRLTLERLLERADVFIHNLAPGAVERLGFDAGTLRTLYPRLVVVTNSGYGEAGPYTGRRAYDAIVQCEAGVVAATGTPDVMVKPGFSAADIASGMYMFAAALTGLFQRERTEDGSVVDIVMLDALTDWMANHIYHAQHSGQVAERISVGHPSVVPYGIYRTADDHEIVVAVQNDREWQRFARGVLRDEALVDDHRMATNLARSANRNLIDETVAEAIGRLDEVDAITLLTQANIAYGQVNSLIEVGDHPQLAARDRWAATDTPVGPVKTLRPVIGERGKTYAVGKVPALGENTESVLTELGFTEEEIHRMTSSATLPTVG